MNREFVDELVDQIRRETSDFITQRGEIKMPRSEMEARGWALDGFHMRELTESLAQKLSGLTSVHWIIEWDWDPPPTDEVRIAYYQDLLLAPPSPN